MPATLATLTNVWPANHKLVPVTVAVSVSDGASGGGGFTMLSVRSNEPDDGTGDGDSANDIQGFTVGTAGTGGLLRAERSATGQGHVYTLTYQGMVGQLVFASR